MQFNKTYVLRGQNRGAKYQLHLRGKIHVIVKSEWDGLTLRFEDIESIPNPLDIFDYRSYMHPLQTWYNNCDTNLQEIGEYVVGDKSAKDIYSFLQKENLQHLKSIIDTEEIRRKSVAILTEEFCQNRSCNMCLHQIEGELLCSWCHSHRPKMRYFPENNDLGRLQKEAHQLRSRLEKEQRILYEELSPCGAD